MYVKLGFSAWFVASTWIPLKLRSLILTVIKLDHKEISGIMIILCEVFKHSKTNYRSILQKFGRDVFLAFISPALKFTNQNFAIRRIFSVQ